MAQNVGQAHVCPTHFIWRVGATLWWWAKLIHKFDGVDWRKEWGRIGAIIVRGGARGSWRSMARQRPVGRP